MARRRLEVDEQQVVRLYKELKSGPKVAYQLGLYPRLVYDVLSKNGVDHRQPEGASDQQIIDLYLETKNGNHVSRALGVTGKRVYDVLRANSIETTGHKEYVERARAFDDEAMRDVIARYRGGETGGQIGKKYGVTTGTVLLSLRKAGIEIREGKPRLSAEEKQEIIKLYKEHMSMKEIGKRLGRTEHTIHRFLRAEHGEIVRPKIRRGSANNMWKGGRSVHKGSGYVYVRIYEDDPYWDMRPKNSNNYILEHRLVTARKLGRPLRDTETVHHIDGDKTNNHPDNLEIRHGKHGKNIAMRCLDCGSHNIGPQAFD